MSSYKPMDRAFWCQVLLALAIALVLWFGALRPWLMTE